MTLTELMQAIDQLPSDELVQLQQYIEDKRKQLLEEKVRMLDEGFAALREGLTEEELAAMTEAMNAKYIEDVDKAEWQE